MRIVRSFNFLLVLVLVVIAAAYWIHYAPELPERIPTHFDEFAQADAWSSPHDFARVFWEIILGFSGLFVAISLFLQIAPAGFIHLPNRDWWLAEERQKKTREEIADSLLGFCAVTLIFFLAVFHLSVRSAIDGSERLGGEFNWVLGAYLAFVALWTGRLIWRYSRPPHPESRER